MVNGKTQVMLANERNNQQKKSAHRKFSHNAVRNSKEDFLQYKYFGGVERLRICDNNWLFGKCNVYKMTE